MCSPSRFLHDIDPCYLAMKAGATIGAPRSRRPSYSDYMVAARQIRYPARQAQALTADSIICSSRSGACVSLCSKGRNFVCNHAGRLTDHG